MGVFGGTTVFLATTNAMFGELGLFQRPDLHRVRKAALTPAFTGLMLAGYAFTEPHLVHGWERIYPEPDRFDPERFLGNSMEAKLNPA